MRRQIAPSMRWSTLESAMRALVPEAFGSDGRALNLVGPEWDTPGQPKDYCSPVDGTFLGTLPMMDPADARRAVRVAAAEGRAWGRVDLDERRRRVAECVGLLRRHRELIARLLVWEIGKPWKAATTDVDRCLDGVEWYLGELESMVAGRTPLGLVSNIASWNYPYSVLVHAVLVQVAAGNAVIAKTPTDGGLFALTVGLALARRCGLPVSLVSGAGGRLGEVLVRDPDVDCLAFVGGRNSGRDVFASLVNHDKRYVLEMEGVNAYGLWEFSDWAGFSAQLRKGWDYGKQRCTAYVRYVVQRRLFPHFLEAYLPVLRSLRIGNPVLVESAGAPLPDLDYGPLIHGRQALALRQLTDEALAGGAIALHAGALDPERFLAGQDTSAYLGPTALFGVPRASPLYFREPFGPVDTIVVVDQPEQLVSEMNISNGALVSTIATDDPAFAERVRHEVRGFKVGVNALRSRGDRDEVFGGLGESWKGCFVGGRHLVHAVTRGAPDERPYGNFRDYTRLPADR
jgi:acyl-CoA reductase-like NAD-dependent aldehyde dehydrogenase